MVPEKRQLDLIEGYALLPPPKWKLVLVGGLGTDEYSERVKQAAQRAGIVLTGFLNGIPLEQIYAHAGAFVLPSAHEGLPIAMLEALSYGLPVLASDIPANLEVGLEETAYFPLGNTQALAAGLARIQASPPDEAAREARRQFVAARYDWNLIAERTLQVYRRVCHAQ
jgi:glycosyltransferase involved in cell wall biosynthesis